MKNVARALGVLLLSSFACETGAQQDPTAATRGGSVPSAKESDLGSVGSADVSGAAKVTPAAVRRMWMSSPTTAPSTQPANSAANEEIRKLMEELKSIRITAAQRRGGAQAETAGEAVSPAEEKPAAATQPASRPTSRPALHPATPVEPLPKELLARLKELSSTALAAPAALGDELYAGGHLQAAYVLYEHSAKNGDPNSKPWALFQMANCVRASDPAAAEQLYVQVVRDHANTAWAAAAEAEGRTLAWLRTSSTPDVLKAVETSAAAATKAASRPSTRPAPTSAPSKGVPGTQVPGLQEGKKTSVSSGNTKGRTNG